MNRKGNGFSFVLYYCFNLNYRVEKGQVDQMRVLEIVLPQNDSSAETLTILPSYNGKLFTIAHYIQVRLDIPFATDPYVRLPLTIWDSQVDEENQQFHAMFMNLSFSQ